MISNWTRRGLKPGGGQVFPPPAHFTGQGPHADQHPRRGGHQGLAQHVGPRQHEFPEDQAGQWSWRRRVGRGGRSVKQRDTHKTWQLRLSMPFQLNLSLKSSERNKKRAGLK